MRLGRRRFLGLSGAGLALTLGSPLTACGPTRRSALPEPAPQDGATPSAFDPSRFTEDVLLFARGVQAGAMSATSAVLWTYARTPSSLTLHVYRRDSAGAVLMVFEVAAPLVDGFAKITASGLGPGWYEYVFTTDDGRRSPVGRFRTAHGSDDQRPLKIGALVCTKLEHAPFDAVRMTLDESPDVLCHLGDFVYADGSVSLQDYRNIWQQTFDEGNYRDHLGRAGLYYTWDDHEFMNNLDPVVLAAEHPEQLAAAKQAALESIATDQTPERIWGSHRWGKTAEFFVVDSRSERIPSTRDGPQATYLSEAQLSWLSEGLVASPAHFKVVLSSVPFARLGNLWAAGGGDRWQGYEAQRQRLLDRLIEAKVENVLFLSGDFHCGLIMRVEPEGPARRFWEVTVGPTGNGPNPIASLADAGYLPREDIYPSRQFAYGSAVWPAVTTIDLDPLNDEVRVRFIDARAATRGTVLFDGLLPRES